MYHFLFLKGQLGYGTCRVSTIVYADFDMADELTVAFACFPVQITKHNGVGHLTQEVNPHVLRVGWSLNNASLQLGLYPPPHTHTHTTTTTMVPLTLR